MLGLLEMTHTHGLVWPKPNDKLHRTAEMDEVWKLYMRITLLTISLNRNHDDVEWMTLHYWIKDINALSVLYNQLNWR